MKRRTITLALAATTMIIAGCHAIFSFEVEKDSGAPPMDAASVEVGTEVDGKVQGDAGQFDSVAQDTGPLFDGSVSPCKNLYPLPGDPIQVSSIAPATAAHSPSITWVNGKFYIAFVESDRVYISEIDPFGPGTSSPVALSPTGAVAHEPWITHNTTDKRLAVLWHHVAVASTCDRTDLYVAELSYGLQRLGEIYKLSPGTGTVYNPWGFQSPCLFHDPIENQYVLTTAVEMGDCSVGHVKHKVFPFNLTGAPVLLNDMYTESIAPLGPTRHTVVTRSVKQIGGSRPYLMLWLRDDGGGGYSLRLYRNTTTPANPDTGWSNWLPSAAPIGNSTVNERPALASDENGTHVAWTTGAFNIHHQILGLTPGAMPVKAVDLLAGGSFGKEPFLVNNAYNDLTALVYTATTANGDPLEVKIVPLTSGGNVLGTVAPVTVRSSVSSPRTPVVAAASNGFGVAWLENTPNTSEVFFQWVGCLP